MLTKNLRQRDVALEEKVGLQYLRLTIDQGTDQDRLCMSLVPCGIDMI